MSERWAPGIGDPSPMGWLTVACYLAAGLLCLRAAFGGDSRDKLLWIVLGLCLLGLAVNKQLDLQSFFTQVARDHALAHGWYEDRLRYQRLFVQLILLVGLTALVASALIFRRRGWPIRLAILGLALLGTFVVARAASFHHVDRLVRSELFGVRWNWTFELSGILIIGLAALFARASNSGLANPPDPSHEVLAVESDGRITGGRS